MYHMADKLKKWKKALLIFLLKIFLYDNENDMIWYQSGSSKY